MGWYVQCTDPNCGMGNEAANIVVLIEKYTDEMGWLRCSTCGGEGYVEKSFELQEPGKTWKPFLRGVVPLGKPNDTYQPFVFLVSYKPGGNVTDMWFSYYKDTRSIGGRLKLGYGPGGPPVLDKGTFLDLIMHLRRIQYISDQDMASLSQHLGD